MLLAMSGFKTMTRLTASPHTLRGNASIIGIFQKTKALSYLCI
jgi:hypothetical protein